LGQQNSFSADTELSKIVRGVHITAPSQCAHPGRGEISSMTYAIIVQENDADHEVELCRVQTNPNTIARAARNKKLYIHLEDGQKKLTSIPKYISVRIEEV
jgi:hypothetical protein